MFPIHKRILIAQVVPQKQYLRPCMVDNSLVDIRIGVAATFYTVANEAAEMLHRVSPVAPNGAGILNGIGNM
jgi:hypothetical protein